MMDFIDNLSWFFSISSLLVFIGIVIYNYNNPRDQRQMQPWLFITGIVSAIWLIST